MRQIHPIEIALGKLLEELNAEFDEAEGRPIQTLTELRQLYAARHALLQFELRRMRARHGDDDPRVQGLVDRLRQSLNLIGDLEVESDLSAEEQPPTVEKGAVLYGRVADALKRGIGGLAVTLVDANDRPIRAVGRAVTEEGGRYILTIAPELLQRLPALSQEGARPAVLSATGQVMQIEQDLVRLEQGSRVRADLIVGLTGGPGRTPVPPNRGGGILNRATPRPGAAPSERSTPPAPTTELAGTGAAPEPDAEPETPSKPGSPAPGRRKRGPSGQKE